jgi:hypothetical protein
VATRVPRGFQTIWRSLYKSRHEQWHSTPKQIAHHAMHAPVVRACPTGGCCVVVRLALKVFEVVREIFFGNTANPGPAR